MLNIDNKLFPYQSRISNYIIQSSIISLIILLFFAYNNNLIVFGQKSDSQFSEQDINIVSAGDFYCNDETEDNINNIISVNPELIFTTGDHVKDEKSAKCWIKMSKVIKDKMKIAIGNHDAEFSKIYKQLLKITT